MSWRHRISIRGWFAVGHWALPLSVGLRWSPEWHVLSLNASVLCVGAVLDLDFWPHTKPVPADPLDK